MSYEIQSHTYRCAATGRTLEEGQTYFAVLRREESGLVRMDYSEEAWQGPPEDVFGFWKGRVPKVGQKPPASADPAVLLELFEQVRTGDNAGDQAIEYLLALMLLRRRIFKLAQVASRESGQVWIMSCSRNGAQYEVVDPGLTPEDLAERQESLTRLLEAGD